MKFSFLFITKTFLLFNLSIGFLHAERETENYYQSCIEIFQDAVKCKEMLNRKNSIPTKEKETSKSNDKKFHTREELKEILYSKNKLFVKKLLGEPEKIHSDASGKEIFIYSTPISKKEESSEFDDEVRIIFFRNMVNRIQFFSNSESNYHPLKSKSKFKNETK